MKVKNKKHAFELRGYEVILGLADILIQKNYTFFEEAGGQYELAILNENVQNQRTIND